MNALAVNLVEAGEDEESEAFKRVHQLDVEICSLYAIVATGKHAHHVTLKKLIQPVLSWTSVRISHHSAASHLPYSSLQSPAVQANAMTLWCKLDLGPVGHSVSPQNTAAVETHRMHRETLHFVAGDT